MQQEMAKARIDTAYMDKFSNTNGYTVTQLDSESGGGYSQIGSDFFGYLNS
jgi:hypothetical protein